MHTSIVLFQCHVAQCLASWGMAPWPPKSSLVSLVSVSLGSRGQKRHCFRVLLPCAVCRKTLGS